MIGTCQGKIGVEQVYIPYEATKSAKSREEGDLGTRRRVKEIPWGWSGACASVS